ncbi:MAG: hypothetical protein CM15mP74_32500 [Halieaceae bacterium]|nr:MAG: hypothetical protein CM15mP74_32500 [Halieaceae bacterium]
MIGGLAGAMPPCWVGRRSPIRLMVTPPAGAHYFCVDAAHFWALAIARKEEYAKVEIPMLPVTHGSRYTAVHSLCIP